MVSIVILTPGSSPSAIGIKNWQPKGCQFVLIWAQHSTN